MIDINIGAITEALNDKEDRDLRNTDTGSGADAVIEFQNPTAENGYAWYRKYASGWVEQGGKFDKGSLSNDIQTTITLPVEMADENYTAVATASRNTASFANRDGTTVICVQSVTQIGIGYYGSSGNTMQYINWQVTGMSAN